MCESVREKSDHTNESIQNKEAFWELRRLESSI